MDDFVKDIREKILSVLKKKNFRSYKEQSREGNQVKILVTSEHNDQLKENSELVMPPISSPYIHFTGLTLSPITT